MTSRNKTILVTGGAGFIGSHLVDALVTEGHDVCVLDNLSTGKREFVNANAEFLERDIRDDLEEVFSRDFDAVFHLAAQINVRTSLESPKHDADINIGGSLNLLQQAFEHAAPHVIFFSSGGAVYSAAGDLPHTEESPISPQSPYGLAKYTVERYIDILAPDTVRTTIIRPSNVYGPRQGKEGEAGVISIFIRQAQAGKPLTIYGDGEQTRDFVYVDDLVRAATEVLHQECEGVYNLSTERETSVNDLAAAIEDVAGDCTIMHTDPIPGEVQKSVLSSRKLNEATGWSPQTSLSEGIRKTYNYQQDAN